VKRSAVEVGNIKAPQMAEPFGEANSLIHARQRPIRVAEQPFAPCPRLPGAHTGIVPTVKECQRAMLFNIVQTAALVAMAAGFGRLARIEIGKPSGVVSLQPQRVVLPVCAEDQQSVRDRACLAYVAKRSSYTHSRAR